MALRRVLFRSDDDAGTLGFGELVKRRRIRTEDNGEDALGIQAQRCQAQLRADTYRTVATWTGGAMLVVVGGVMAGTYALVTDSAQEIRRDISVIASGHSHDDHVRTREITVLRDSINQSMDRISDQISGISEKIDKHSIIDKHPGAMPLDVGPRRSR